MMMIRRMFAVPALRSESFGSGRPVSWMELFYDLIFVAAVAQIAKPLVEDYSFQGALRYSFLFVLIWWAWSGHTLYATRFHANGKAHQILLFLQCFIAAVMAANASEPLDSRSSAGFTAAYAAIRILLALQYWNARRRPETRAMAGRFAAGVGLAALLWLASAILPVPLRYLLWALAAFIDLATPWTAEQLGEAAPPDPEHLPERFGLFTIILLGEFIASLMRGISNQEYWSVPAASTAMGAVAFAFLLRWWYFDIAKSAEERHVKTRAQIRQFRLWSFAHLPLYLSIGIVGVGFEHLISLKQDSHFHLAEATLFLGFACLLSISLVLIGGSTEKGSNSIWGTMTLAKQFAVSALLLVGIGSAEDLNQIAIMGLLLGICTLQAHMAQRAGRPQELIGIVLQPEQYN